MAPHPKEAPIFKTAPQGSRLSSTFFSVHCSVWYTAWAVYTPATLLKLQWTCSVHCTTLQVHSTSVWALTKPWTYANFRQWSQDLVKKFTQLPSMIMNFGTKTRYKIGHFTVFENLVKLACQLLPIAVKKRESLRKTVQFNEYHVVSWTMVKSCHCNEIPKMHDQNGMICLNYNPLGKVSGHLPESDWDRSHWSFTQKSIPSSAHLYPLKSDGEELCNVLLCRNRWKVMDKAPNLRTFVSFLHVLVWMKCNQAWTRGMYCCCGCKTLIAHCQ